MLHQCSAPLHWPQVRPVISLMHPASGSSPASCNVEMVLEPHLGLCVFPSLHPAGPGNPTMTGMWALWGCAPATTLP